MRVKRRRGKRPSRTENEKIFTYDEAKKLLPTIKLVTAEALERAGTLIVRSEGIPLSEERKEEVDAQLSEVIDQWVAKVRSYGCHVRRVGFPLWLIKFGKSWQIKVTVA